MNDTPPFHKHVARGPETADLVVATITIASDYSVTMSQSSTDVTYAAIAIEVVNQCDDDVWLTIAVSNSSTNEDQCPVALWALKQQTYYGYAFFGGDMDQVKLSCQLSDAVQSQGTRLSGTTNSTYALSDLSCQLTFDASGQPTQSWMICSAGSIYFDTSATTQSLYYYTSPTGAGTAVPTSADTPVAVASTIPKIWTSTTNSTSGLPPDAYGVDVYYSDNSTVSIIQDPDDPSQTIAVPYAVTPSGDDVTVNCVSLATGATEITIWAEQPDQGKPTSSSEKVVLSPPPNSNSSHTFDVSKIWNQNLALSWVEGGDPKVVIKNTGCDDGS